jgi:hypothetical protein
MVRIDEILIAQAQHLEEVAHFMATDGDNLTKEQAKEVSTVIQKNADNLRKLAEKVEA